MSFSITLPDGSKKDFDKAVSVKEVASSIATSLGKAAVGAKVNGVVKPLDYEIDNDVEVAILTDKDEEGLDILRATAAFALEAVAKNKYPELFRLPRRFPLQIYNWDFPGLPQAAYSQSNLLLSRRK